MDMEAATEEAVSPPFRCIDPIAKGKRTKRQRPNSPVSFTVVASPRAAAGYNLPPRSPTTFFAPASSEESTTTEEADTARCLLLLSRGGPKRRRDEAAATTSYGGACMYACKTCGRSFPSFQALGGHRASHRKPKNERKSAILSDEEDFTSPSPSSKNRFSPASLSLQLSSASTATPKSSPSPRTHVCSYCGAEFASGQALGGHMRKHRGGAAPPIGRSPFREEAVVEERNKGGGNWLSLDLNLPAPDDERERSPNRNFPPLLLHR